MNELAVIVNQKARNADKAIFYIDALKKEGSNITVKKVNPDDITTSLEEVSSSHSMIFVGGGDGTIRSAAQWVLGKKNIVIGVLPIGTMNHFAKELCLPMTPEDVAMAVKLGDITSVDVAEVNGKIFINNASIGIYPKFATIRDHYNKFYNKWLCYIPSMVASLKKHPIYDLKLSSSQLKCQIKTSFLMISCNMYAYEFPMVLKRDSFTGASLGVYYYKYGKFELAKLFHAMFNIKKNFEIQKISKPLRIDSSDLKTIQIALDGETMRLQVPLNFQLHLKTFNVLGAKP